MGRLAAKNPAEWVGTDRYEVVGCLGQGGMGVVYEVFDRERRQLVALKKLLRYDPAALYLFKQEFRTLADVRHTNLVHLYELVVGDGDTAFFTTELVRGADFLQYARSVIPKVSSNPPETVVSLKPGRPDRETVRPPGADARKGKTPIPLRSAADVDRLRPALRQLVEGIHALHLAGKLHRDVKPSNVLVTAEGRVVLLDFGVATELRGRAGEAAGGSGEVVGTARYMAPEQAGDEARTPASDWYSVGVMLYEALVGRAPFVGSTVDVLTRKSLMDATPPADVVDGVPSDLDALCRALLHRDPAMRPEGAEILRRLGVTRSSAPPPQLATRETDAAFIGRTAELETLRAAFDATRSGRSVTVRVGGASGMGKSTLVHHFLDGVATRGEAVVLRGRAYEREAVPYKAVDTLIDSLSRHLLRLTEDDVPLSLPADAWLIARLFPVLGRVRAFGALTAQSIDDPRDVRHRAFAALRQLLAGLALRQPIVLFVDDAQWGDVDSAALLLDLLRPPDAPPMMIVMTYRDDEAQASPFLTELRDRWPAEADVRDVHVAPLAIDDARLLAVTLPRRFGRGRDEDRASGRARVAGEPVSRRGARVEQSRRDVRDGGHAGRSHPRPDDRRAPRTAA
jgi:serine/threonine protein kinase